MVFSAVGGRVLALKIALFDQIVDLIGRIGLGNVQKVGKLPDSRPVQQVDDFQREGFHSGQGAVPLSYKVEYAAVEMSIYLTGSGGILCGRRSSSGAQDSPF